MRSLLLGLLSTAAVAMMLAPATAAEAAKTIEWERFDEDGVHLDVPKGWTVDVSDGGNTVSVSEEPGNNYKMSLTLLRRTAKKSSNAVTIARQYIEAYEYRDAVLAPGYGTGDRDHAVVIGEDSLHFNPARIGVRVDIDRTDGVIQIAVFRALYGDFYTADGMAFADRVLTSADAPKQRASHYTTWKWESYRDEHVKLSKPKGWNVDVDFDDKNQFFIKIYDGETLDASDHAVLLVRVKSPKEFKKVSKAPAAALRKMFPDARLLNPGERTRGTLISDTDDAGTEYRAGMTSRTSSEFVTLAIGVAEPDDFWQAGMQDAATAILDNVGLGDDQIIGIWIAGSASGLMNHYDADGEFLRTSSTGKGMVLAFDKKGGYAFKYLFTNDFSSSTSIWSDEDGTYTFDGRTLRLEPKQRTVHVKSGSKVEHRTFKKKDLEPIELTVRRQPEYAAAIKITGPGLEYIGWAPHMHQAVANAEGRSSFTFSRYEK